MKKILLYAFSVATIISALVYITACLTPYVGPASFWPLAFLALGYPYLVAGMFLLIAVWIFIRKKVSFFLLIILLAGYKNLFSTIGLHPFTKPVTRPDSTLRIITWNVRGFDNPSTYLDTPGSLRQRIFDYIRDSAADVICMQEFADHLGKGMLNNTTEMLDLGYNYFIRTDDFRKQFAFGFISSGSAIFSKLPIIAQGKMMFDDPSHPEYVAYADILFQNKPLRIFSTHFKSLNLNAILIDSNNRSSYYGDSTFLYTASKFEKLKIFPQAHARESIIAKTMMNNSPYPLVFCGDMNSIPASYAYHVMSDNLQDVFLKRGFGLGTTMDSLPKPLRIDFILADKKLEIKNYVKNDLHMSDHYPQIVDFAWKK